MLDHPIVDVALGLILLYSVLSLVASVVKEWISTLFGLRAKNLRKGIQTLIGDDYATRLYGHPLVSTLAREKKLPSYIGSGTFASSLVDVLAHGEDGKRIAGMEDKAAGFVDNVNDDPVLGPALRALSSAGAKTVADLRSEIAAWFDESMNRVSGWYRRRTQMIILAIGAVVTVTANASTVHVVRDLWQDDALRYAVAQEAIRGGVHDGEPGLAAGGRPGEGWGRTRISASVSCGQVNPGRTTRPDPDRIILGFPVPVPEGRPLRAVPSTHQHLGRPWGTPSERGGRFRHGAVPTTSPSSCNRDIGAVTHLCGGTRNR